jgi:hypothetical protein
VRHVPQNTRKEARHRFEPIKLLARKPLPLGERVKQLESWFRVSVLTIERGLRLSRKNPGLMALVPPARRPKPRNRRMIPERQSVLPEVIESWAPSGRR